MFLNLLNLLLKCVWMVLSSQIKDNSMKSSKPSKSVALPRTFSAFYIMLAVPFTKDVCLWFKETLFWNFLYGLFVIKVKASSYCIFKNVWVLPSFMYRFILLLIFFLLLFLSLPFYIQYYLKVHKIKPYTSITWYQKWRQDY